MEIQKVTCKNLPLYIIYRPSFVRVILVIKMVSKKAVQVSIYDLCPTYCFFFISDGSSCIASIDSRPRPTQSKRKN